MSGYTPYYGGGWQSGESGGTPITPAALNNMESGISAALTSADVVNNLTSTATNKPLSAAQGKVLNDKIAQDSYTSGGVTARKFGAVVSLSAKNLPIDIVGYGTQLFTTLPSEYRPVNELNFPLRARNSGNGKIFDIMYIVKTNGEVIASNYASGESATGTQNGFVITYITSA